MKSMAQYLIESGKVRVSLTAASFVHALLLIFKTLCGAKVKYISLFFYSLVCCLKF